MICSLLNALLYSPSRAVIETPGRAGVDYRDLSLETDDGEQLHGWWIAARNESLGHLLLAMATRAAWATVSCIRLC